MKRKSLYFKEHPYCLYQSVENSPFPLPTNSQGLIGKKEYTKIKKENTFRILVLGASPIERLPPEFENIKKNPNFTFTHFLEKSLNNLKRIQDDNQTYEVLNLSSSGYTSYECLFSYICKGKNFNPDLIISYQGVNDVLWAIMTNEFKSDYSHARKNNFKQNECLINNIICALPDSKYIDFIERLLVKFKFKKPNGLIYSITKKNLKIDPHYNSKKLEPFVENIKILNNLSNLYSSKLLNLSFIWDKNSPPNPSHIYKQLENMKHKKIFKDHYNNYLIEINERLKNSEELNFLDLNQFEIKKNFFHDGVHFSLLGMKEIAKIVAEYIILNKTRLNN